MGIETAAIGALAPEILAGTAAATTAAGAGATAAGLGAAGAGATAGALGAAEAAGAVAGSLEAANAVGMLGGDALGAFISANQGWGTMTMAESLQGFMGALGESPVIQGLMAADEAANQGEEPPTQSTAPAAYDVQRPNQGADLTQSSSLMMQDNYGESSALAGLGFEDGGLVPKIQQIFPDNIFARTRAAQEEQAGLGSQQGNVTINIGGSGQPYGGMEHSPPQRPQQRVPVPPPSMEQLGIALQQFLGSFGQYQNGGKVRSGSSDVAAGGKIRGPQSKTGKDNQIIAVAGGEGIIPKDVMEVPGVADLLQSLIQTYHKPL